MKLLYNSKCLLTEKKNDLVQCTQTKSSKDLVKNFEKGHTPLNGYFENKIVQNFERVVRVM